MLRFSMRSALAAVIGTLVYSGVLTAGSWGSVAFAKEEPSQLTKVSVARSDDDIAVVVRGSQPPNFTSFTLNKPFRVVLDWAGSQLAGVQLEREFDRGLIRRIRVRQFSSEAEQISRVIVELVEPTTYRVEADGNAVIMHFVPVAPPPPPPPDPAEPEDPEPLDPDKFGDLDEPSDPDLGDDGFEPLDDFGDSEDDLPAEDAPREDAPPEAAPPPAEPPRTSPLLVPDDVPPQDEEESVTPDITLDQVNQSLEMADGELPPLDELDDDPYEDLEDPPEAEEIPPAADPRPEFEAPPAPPPAAPPPRRPQRRRAFRASPQAAAGFAASSQSADEFSDVPSDGRDMDRPDLGVDGRRAMREIGFLDGPQVDKVFVKTDKLTRYRQHFEGRTFVLELLDTRVPRRNDLNPLPTRYFDSPVLHVQARPRRRLTRVEIKLRDEVKWRIKRNGPEIAVYFERR